MRRSETQRTQGSAEALRGPRGEGQPPAGSARPPRKAVAALVLAVIGGLCFLGAVLLYEEPKSFYTNFVLFPTLALMAIGSLADLTAILLALVSLRGKGRNMSLLALALGLLIPILSMATIQLVLRD